MSAIPELIDWQALADAKLNKILGAEEARSVMNSALQQIGLATLGSADDLYSLAQKLKSMDGFARVVGGMLSLDAVMRGARPQT